jgi:hypothetical protein
MPFLDELSKKGYLGRVRTSPGFTQEAALLTGRYPEETDYFTWYRYAPTNSPFSWVRPLRPLNHLRKSRLYYPIKVGIRILTRMITGEKYPDPEFIPLDILPNFQNISATMPSHLPTLVSICKESKLACFEQPPIRKLAGSIRCGTLFENVLKTIASGRIFDLYLIHVGELDRVGHRCGPRPDLFREYLLEMDNWIKRIYQFVEEKGFACNIVVVSDHGMTDVRGTVDVESYIRRTPLRVSKDYLYFLDSTMARFWFMSTTAEGIIQPLLSIIPHGHVLEQEEKGKLHLNFKNNHYGDVLFWLDKGYMIFPNFFQSFGEERTRGMHGYINDDDGAIIVYSDRKQVRKENRYIAIPLTEVFNIVRELMDI